ncbi:glycosyltransferase family 4 protein [Endozoicomonas lisbonensis]|uniref:Glycosyltransferase involved in cell wall biosynthesis n=1 Tax=Endozoicomonas lisbonensis TaxID=3120522 RepID=A0ABV2SMM0_9GAMM
MAVEKGVNFFGSWETSDGIGRAAGLNIRSLEAAGVKLDRYVLSRPVALQSGRDTIIDDRLLSSLHYKVNLFQFSARWVPHYFSRLSEGALDGFYNIGYWFCEVPRIPDYWARQMEFFDEIWTASTFCETAFARSANIPVVRIPLLIELRKPTARILLNQSGQYQTPFTFLTIFNTYSDAERKNILFSIRAFISAFDDNPEVKLIIKVSNLEHDAILREKLHAIQQHHANIEVIEGYIENNAVQALYDEADVYVSLHRAEGFGLTISDAMSRGVPVITTGYSGNMEFCEGSDSRLVTYKLRSVGHERLRYQKDDIWAEPDMEDAVSAFRELYTSYPTWLLKADRARSRILQAFSIEQVGGLMRERLALINSNFTFSSDMGQRQVDRTVGVLETYGF